MEENQMNEINESEASVSALEFLKQAQRQQAERQELIVSAEQENVNKRSQRRASSSQS
jgi:hypothetical protein